MDLHCDLDIRAALHSQKLRRHVSDRDTLVVDELGLAHARSRIDVAVLNGCIHGYEIKSERDSLDRLERQLQIYRQSLARLTYVCSSCHVEATLQRVPVWCGIIEARRGQRGAVSFKTIRRAGANPDLDPRILAHLLWRQEATKLLSQKGIEGAVLQRPRQVLYSLIAEHFTVHELTAAIKNAIRQRGDWRGRRVQLSYDG
jgi:hypothetical protein